MVAVRAIAAKELTVINKGRTIGKEILVGGINGLLLAIILTFIVGALFSDLDLGAVFAIAIIINMVFAGFIGVAVPIALHRVGVDPAVALSVLVIANTDIIGFLLLRPRCLANILDALDGLRLIAICILPCSGRSECIWRCGRI